MWMMEAKVKATIQVTIGLERLDVLPECLAFIEWSSSFGFLIVLVVNLSLRSWSRPLGLILFCFLFFFFSFLFWFNGYMIFDVANESSAWLSNILKRWDIKASNFWDSDLVCPDSTEPKIANEVSEDGNGIASGDFAQWFFSAKITASKFRYTLHFSTSICPSSEINCCSGRFSSRIQKASYGPELVSQSLRNRWNGLLHNGMAIRMVVVEISLPSAAELTQPQWWLCLSITRECYMTPPSNACCRVRNFRPSWLPRRLENASEFSRIDFVNLNSLKDGWGGKITFQFMLLWLEKDSYDEK